MADAHALAHEIADAYAHRREIAVPPSARDGGLDLATAYAVEAQLVRLRSAAGQRTLGRKVGFANKAMWRALKLDTLVWAHIYDDTVRYAKHDRAELPLGRMYSPKIEPEIVFRLNGPLEEGVTDAIAVLERVEWLALGFEIIDCVFPGWTFTPADFVASYGLHAGLVVGTPLLISGANRAALAEHLPAFTVTLSKNGVVAAEGSGKNSLRSPALSLGELASAIARQPGVQPLAAGELISSGTLTESQPIAVGETWTAEIEGLDVPALTVRTVD